MNAGPLTDILALGGHGPYVWGSLALCAMAFTIEVLALRARRQALVQALSQSMPSASHSQPGTPTATAARTPTLTQHGGRA